MLFMVIERFKKGSVKEVYRRASEKGRMLPDGVKYVDSWVDSNFERCFQLMESTDRHRLDEWMGNWNDLVEFEVIPVVTSEEADELVGKLP